MKRETQYILERGIRLDKIVRARCPDSGVGRLQTFRNDFNKSYFKSFGNVQDLTLPCVSPELQASLVKYFILKTELTPMTFPVLHNTVARNAEHSRPLFPSVHRLLLEHTVTNLENIKGTGVRGMLTKGDVLTFLGKASNPLGTFKFGLSPIEEASKLVEKEKDVVPVRHICSPSSLNLLLNSCPFSSQTPPTLDGAAIRRLIVNSMLQSSIKARNPPSGMFSYKHLLPLDSLFLVRP